MSHGWLEWKKGLKIKSAKIADAGGGGEKKKKAKNSKQNQTSPGGK